MQFVAVASHQATNPVLDIVIDSEINLQTYCTALVDKIIDLPQSKFTNFISYQLDRANDPLNWLDSFNELLINNWDLFIQKKAVYRCSILYNLIRSNRDLLQCTITKPSKFTTPKRLVNAETEDRYFSFSQTKDYVESLSGFNDKIIYLTEEIFEYRQADIISKNNKLQDYDLQCGQLIEKLQTLRRMKLDFEGEQVYSGKLKPLRINGAINILTNVFKQMMNDAKYDGKPYLQYKIKDVSEFICENFVDENGAPLSQSTVQTYLSPSRIDKDPNNDSYIKT